MLVHGVDLSVCPLASASHQGTLLLILLIRVYETPTLHVHDTLHLLHAHAALLALSSTWQDYALQEPVKNPSMYGGWTNPQEVSYFFYC